MSIQTGRRGLFLGALLAVVAIGLAIYFYSRPGGNVSPGTTTATTTAAPAVAPAENGAAATAPVTPPPPETAKLSIAELLKNAATALSEGRLVEPAGNNAVEFYLLVLDRDSNNRAATDGLREMFPLATGAVEQQINAGQIDAGMRMITLMGKADPANYTLTILRNKLDLKKKQMEKEQEKRDQEKQLAANAARNQNAAAAASTAAAAAPVPATSAPATASAPAPASASNAAGAAPASAATAAATNPAAATAAVDSRAATLLQKVNPSYPPDAARKHTEGWVEVSFTVGSDGHVKDPFVIGANPARVFNDAALRAVANWTFDPRLENGKPVEQHIKSRIEFKLGAG
jgi:protein TonB